MTDTKEAITEMNEAAEAIKTLAADIEGGKLAALEAQVEELKQSAGATIVAKAQQLDDFLQSALLELQASQPVMPNLITDTKRFTGFCGGAVGEPQDIITAHGGPWSAFWYGDGTQGQGTAEVLTLDRLEDKGFEPSGALLKALGEPASKASWSGSDFRVLLLDVEITGGTKPNLFVMNQGCPKFTGWGRGEFVTQSRAMINVLSQSGDINFDVQNNMPPSLIAGPELSGQGWTQLNSSKRGWGGCHQPRFHGLGQMTVAIALPYVSFGDHGDNFVWAGSLGRWSHEDRLASGFSY